MQINYRAERRGPQKSDPKIKNIGWEFGWELKTGTWEVPVIMVPSRRFELLTYRV